MYGCSWLHTALYDHNRQEYQILAWDTGQQSADLTCLLLLAVLRSRWAFPTVIGVGLPGGLVAPLTLN